MGRHNLQDVVAAEPQFISFNVNDPATVWGVAGPENFISDITVANTAGPGRYDVTIRQFLGPRGFAHVFPALIGTSTQGGLGFGTSGIFVTTAPSYSSDTLTFGIGINTGAAVGLRANFSVLVIAY